MTHRNAPLTPQGRYRLVMRVQAGRPIAHVAAEAGIARATLSKWVARYRQGGISELEDRSSAPFHCPTRTSAETVDLIEHWRRTHKWSARRISHELAVRGTMMSARTVTRWLDRAGLNRRRDIDPTGQTNRVSKPILARFPGHMIHLDVKKVGRIPPGGGWRAHGRGTPKAKASKRGKATRIGYTYLHTAIDGFSRLAYTEALDDEKASTTIGFFCRARAFFATHGITRLVRVVLMGISWWCLPVCAVVSAVTTTPSRPRGSSKSLRTGTSGWTCQPSSSWDSTAPVAWSRADSK